MRVETRVLLVLRKTDWNINEATWFVGFLLSQLVASYFLRAFDLLGQKLSENNGCGAMQLLCEEQRISAINLQVECKIWVGAINLDAKLGPPKRVGIPRSINFGTVLALRINPPNCIPLTLPKWGWTPHTTSWYQAHFDRDFSHGKRQKGGDCACRKRDKVKGFSKSQNFNGYFRCLVWWGEKIPTAMRGSSRRWPFFFLLVSASQPGRIWLHF